MKDLKSYLSRRISHANARINQLKLPHGNNPAQTHNYYGGWDLGYWEGKLSVYENLLDAIKEMDNEMK